MSVLARLHRELEREGGLLAEQLAAADGEPGPGPLAASGPRTAAAADEYELLVEAIYEGYLLHYDRPRLFRCEDADLALLAGDRLYALGLDRLVALGDIVAVRELADVILLCALVHARGEGEAAGAIWEAGARAIGWGPNDAHEHAKGLLRAGSEDALAALRGAAASLPRD
jgi:hypothetical protein